MLDGSKRFRMRAISCAKSSSKWLLCTPSNIIINEALARRFFPNEEPIGQRLVIMDGQPHEIIGVAGKARQLGLNLPPSPEVYFSHTQASFSDTVSLVVRTQNDPAGLAESVRRAVHTVNPDAP